MASKLLKCWWNWPQISDPSGPPPPSARSWTNAAWQWTFQIARSNFFGSWRKTFFAIKSQVHYLGKLNNHQQHLSQSTFFLFPISKRSKRLFCLLYKIQPVYIFVHSSHSLSLLYFLLNRRIFFEYFIGLKGERKKGSNHILRWPARMFYVQARKKINTVFVSRLVYPFLFKLLSVLMQTRE